MKKIALLTGASKGIGLSFLRLLVKDSTIEEVWAISRTKNDTDKKIRWFNLDLTDPRSYDEITTALKNESVKIKLLINNAGAGKIDDFKNTTLEEDEWVMNLNMNALVRVTKISLPYMDHNSAILQVASTAGFIPLPSMSLYAATKAFVLSFSEGLSSEIKKDKISLTVVCPGPVETNFFDFALGSRPYKKSILLNSPDEVAKKALLDAQKKKLYSFDRFLYGPLLWILKMVPKTLSLPLLSSFKRKRLIEDQ